MAVNVIDYLKNEIRPSVETDIVRVAAYHGRHRIDNGGHFSIPRNVFCLIDHLGYIAYGDESSTNRGVRFIENFFPLSYHKFAELLWAMWRHGVVHEYRPISFHSSSPKIPSGRIQVKWLSTNHNRKNEKAQHMLPFAAEGKSDTVFIVSNTCQLAEDLLDALDRFIRDLEIDTIFQRECSQRIATLTLTHDYTTVKGKLHQKRILQEIICAWKTKGGMLDNGGNIKRGHPELKKDKRK